MSLLDRTLPPGLSHPAPRTVATEPSQWQGLVATVAAHLNDRPDPDRPGDDALAAVASSVRHLLPDTVAAALAAHLRDPGPAGAFLIRGVPTGELPATPATPTHPGARSPLGEAILLATGFRLGEPVGYLPEHGGALVQNLVPTRDGATRQTSTSSAVDLEFHTETAFHPHRPRQLLLSCLRGDPAATTLLCSVRHVLPHLDPSTIEVLGQPRFRTRADESFGGGRRSGPGPLVRVLSGDPHDPTLLFDADLMDAEDDEAAAALGELRTVARSLAGGVVLEPGDLLVVDNHACIHGRTAYTPRWDGTDRWLQRTFVVEDLAPSAAERDGRIITTTF